MILTETYTAIRDAIRAFAQRWIRLHSHAGDAAKAMLMNIDSQKSVATFAFVRSTGAHPISGGR